MYNDDYYETPTQDAPQETPAAEAPAQETYEAPQPETPVYEAPVYETQSYEPQAQPGYSAPQYAPPVREYQPEVSGWSEPRYTGQTSGYAAYTPGVTYYNPPAEPPKKEKKQKSHGFIKAVAIVLSCVLLSSAASYGVASYVMSRAELNPTVTENRVVLGAASTDSDDASGETHSVTSTGAIKSGSQIYADACNYQVVGVNTSVNTTNIFGQTTQSAVSGSGFVVSEDGYILTNYHVISYAVVYGGELTIMFEDGTSVSAEKIVGYSEENDVAVIKIDASALDFKLNPVTLGDSDKIVVGETVYAIGNPLGELTYTMTPGIVSALDRVITTSASSTTSATSINMFQISAAVNSGNSGGPVYNDRGEVIGIVTAKYSDSGVEGLGFAIPINDAISLATQLIEKGYISGASLGIICSDVSQVYSSFAMQYYHYPDGVVVLSVNEGSAAETAGLMKDDIIVAINGDEIGGTDELKMYLRRVAPGDEGTLTVYRMDSTLGEGKTVELKIVFDESQPQEETKTQQPQTQQTPGWYWYGGSGNQGGGYGG